ncbi:MULTISPECIES: ribbon-helix-helix protein, CopG family [Xanthomonas]|uniref:Uncharacterized protein n=1 Tax=Xanthomonas arboricola pv. corylina TaxID=487821 RepID=A0A2S7C0G0_9XANT|nr:MULTISPECIES: ribbon-helix-helix protein, CopG family [Xanthomonas]KHS08568.1 hypothetical protein RM61_04450 [Xanthomonas phaseoli pv. phaseoli]MBB3779185.1 putative transcriptional regulator [Xanthomonas euroxanthea]MCD0274296.1 hypothetical protein [Xanthomonas campestris pv. campestris]MCF8788330.1 hypothetical protein [Xanthomonas campestris pv. campestris]MCF8802369.1 hypothetical protein [Xanthomonas campestris pv. campestris]
MSTRRYTIDLDANFDATLSSLASQKGTTKAEIIRRALATYTILSQQTQTREGQKVSITDSADHVLKNIMVP